MIKRIFSTITVLMLVSGCVGTLKMAEEDTVKGNTPAPVHTKLIEDHDSSINNE